MGTLRYLAGAAAKDYQEFVMAKARAEKKSQHSMGSLPPQIGDGQAGLTHDDADIARMSSDIAEAREAERHARIEMAAYFRAQQRGFEPGHELEDWLAAEAEQQEAPLTSSSPAGWTELGSAP